jgi:V/A-type H+-transporting ATPase subunit K
MKAVQTSCLLSYLLTLLAGTFVLAGIAGKAYAQDPDPHSGAVPAIEAGEGAGVSDRAWLAIAAGITVGITCIATGYAVGKVGSAALGAASEKPEILGRALLFVGLAEGVAIYGFVIAIIIAIKM